MTLSMTTIEPPRETRLPNGLRVITEHMPGVASVSLSVHVGAGARAEAEREHGIAHLLEHMAFKGTNRRSARDIAEEIEAVGGDINAATSMESTAYYARVLSADVPLALDILADILTDSVIDEAELAREQGVIRQEIAAVFDTPDDLVFEHLQAATFPGQALGRSILGTEESVSGFTVGDIRGFLDQHYLADHTIVAAAGDVDHDALVDRVGTLLGGLKRGEPAAISPCRFVGGEIRDEDGELEQVNIALALPGVPLGDPNIHCARLFATVLGGGMASRLFQEVREKRGLAYSVSAFHWGYAETGLMGMHAATAPQDVAELVPVLIAELAKAARELDRAELDRAKAQLRASLLMSLESSGARAERVARQALIYGRPLTIQESLAAVEKIGVDEVRAFGASTLSAKKAALAVVGASDGLESLDRLIDSHA
jgi:predicted Zn-dependent peptidase